MLHDAARVDAAWMNATGELTCILLSTSYYSLQTQTQFL